MAETGSGEQEHTYSQAEPLVHRGRIRPHGVLPYPSPEHHAMSAARYVHYRGHRIEPRVWYEQTSGEWVAGEYLIRWTRDGMHVEEPFAHEPQFFDTEAEATRATVRLAMDTIDRGEVSVTFKRAKRAGRPKDDQGEQKL